MINGEIHDEIGNQEETKMLIVSQPPIFQQKIAPTFDLSNLAI